LQDPRPFTRPPRRETPDEADHAIIKPFKVDDVRQAIADIGVQVSP